MSRMRRPSRPLSISSATPMSPDRTGHSGADESRLRRSGRIRHRPERCDQHLLRPRPQVPRPPGEDQDDELVVAMSDPANIFAIDDLRIVTGYGDPPRRRLRERSQPGDRASSPRVRPTSTACSATWRTLSGADDEDDDDEAEDAGSAAAKLMNGIVTEAIRQGAGDIYIEPQETRDARPVPRRRCVPGGIHATRRRSTGSSSADSRSSPAWTSPRSESRRTAASASCWTAWAWTSVWRSCLSSQGELAVMRLLRRDSILMSLEDLGFLEQPLERLMDRAIAALRSDPCHRADRFGQVDDAVRGHQPHERRRRPTSSPSRIRSSTACQGSPRSRSTRRPGSRSRRRCARSSGRTRTPSWSVRSETRRPARSPSRPRSRATSCSRPCTRTMPRRRSRDSPRWASSRS